MKIASHGGIAKSGFTIVTALFSSLALSGCLVAGVSSSGGFFIWPGSIGLLLLLLIVFFILRRR
jgi:hypothetical protein